MRTEVKHDLNVFHNHHSQCSFYESFIVYHIIYIYCINHHILTYFFPASASDGETSFDVDASNSFSPN